MKTSFFFTFLFFLIVHAYSAQVDTLRIESQAMHKSVSNVVITPASYSQGNQFPVVYLLHGAGDTYKKWASTVPQIKDLADRYKLIIVCPDGGYTSWYFDSPIDPTMKYETYVSQELITTIDQKYKTIPEPAGRAITGLSMGGHGAFYLAFRHQDIWGAAGSMSGGLDICPFPNNWDIPKRLGSYAENKEIWEDNSVINLVYLLDGRKLKLAFECGVDDFFYDANKRMHEKLLERNIPHDYTERPGVHNWNYWANAIKYQLLFFNDFFQTK